MILDNSAIRLVPGSDESELYVSWHSPADAEKAELMLSLYPDMSCSLSFKAETLEAEDPGFRINRTIVRGLQPQKQYYYAVSYGGEAGETFSFKTYDPHKHSALFSTDVQLGRTDEEDYPYQLECWNKTINTAVEKAGNISYIVHCGDQTVTGRNFDEWYGYYSPDALRNIPIFSVIGNHDRKGDTFNYYTYYPNQFDMRYPSCPNESDTSKQPPIGKDCWFRCGDVLYVSFDTTCGSASDHYKCAKAAVRANPGVKWKIALMHHDLYGGTSSAGDIESTVLFRQIYTPIFDKLGFDVALTGHSHSYSRSYQMFNRKIVEETKDETVVLNPVGTVYISGCCGGNKYDPSYQRIAKYYWTAYRYESLDNVSTVLNFDDNSERCSLTVETYKCDGGEKIDSYTIIKTKQKPVGGSPVKNALSSAKFRGIRGLAGIYMACDTAYRYYQGKKAGETYTPHNG